MGDAGESSSGGATLAHLGLLAAMAFWGWSFVATKVLLEYLSPAQVVGSRLLLGVPPMLLILRWRGGAGLASVGQVWLPATARARIAVCGIVVALHFGIQSTALQYTTATNTGWLIAVTPLAIALLSVGFLKERLGWAQIVGIAVATVGVMVLVSRGHLSDLARLTNVGDWLVLASTFNWAVYTVLARTLSKRHSSFAISTWVLSVAAFMTLVYLAFVGGWGAFVELPPEAYGALLFLSIFALSVAFWLWQRGVDALGASRAGFFLYLEPLFTTALAVPYLGEHFGWQRLPAAF